jgi:hypothetical protein
LLDSPSRGMVEMLAATASGLFLGSRHNPHSQVPSILRQIYFIIHLSL